MKLKFKLFKVKFIFCITNESNKFDINKVIDFTDINDSTFLAKYYGLERVKRLIILGVYIPEKFSIPNFITKVKVKLKYYLSKIYSKPLDIPYSYFEVDSARDKEPTTEVFTKGNTIFICKKFNTTNFRDVKEGNSPQEKKIIAFCKDNGFDLSIDARYNETMDYIEKLHNKKVIKNSKYIQQLIKEEYS